MKRLVIVGDTFLDIDIHGRSDRLCPEAPVPVVDAAREVRRPGAAGLAAMLAARDSPRTSLITALGDDQAGRQLRELLEPHVDLVAMPLAGTTVRKIRIRVGNQLITRIDHGDGRSPTGELDEAAAMTLLRADAVLVADYGRGIAEHSGLRRLLAELAPAIPIVWDPHPSGPLPVRGLRLVTPNQAEAERLAPGADNHRQLAEHLRGAFASHAVAVTRGAQGATLATETQTTRVPPPPDVPVAADRWVDTCGAGDQFSAAAANALLTGGDVHRAVSRGVEAASRFVAAGGVGVLHGDQSADEPEMDTGIVDAFELAARVRGEGGTLVATGGCFDLLHPGHVSLLRRARSMGDALVVCLNSDDSIRMLKGAGRPILTAADRARLLAELAVVDAVVVFDEPTPTQVLERLRPHIWVKGADYAGRPIPESHTVYRHGGEVVVVPTVDGYSTTKLIATMSTQT
ncbi:PfkB family carbohydrate kinase [Glycomyces arizonensis]|uniref:PfkB family carbohydrate kinase n=1 Tax=Glycomyces arizonensis TaxID=256035 RepID=UPI00047B6F6F|nr:PfkB family carbohydrate kinase [Glycomyces arizonensis]